MREVSRGGRWTVARPVLWFALAGLVAVVIVGVATQIASRRVGTREAIVDARTTTLIKAQTVVEPVITDGLITGRPAAVAKVDRVVRTSVLDDSLVRVKIWARDGTILYSDEPRLAGTTYDLGEDEVAALDHGVIEAEVSDLTKPENRFERSQGKLLEVYLPVRTPSGVRVLFEAYYRYGAVAASGRRIWRSFAPVTIGSLVALELVQIPLAWSLARRLRQRQREREVLLQSAIEASDAERRRVAADLHDGVVQDLAGVAYDLAGTARQRTTGKRTADLLDQAATQVQDSIKSLRTLLVDIYPPKLAEAGLAAALSDLAGTVANRGIDVTCELDSLDVEPPEAAARLLYRAAQEAVRNVITHARAEHMTLRVERTDGLLSLHVADDGVGFELATRMERAGQGHLGLRGLSDLVDAAGGRLEVVSTPGVGTTVDVEVPV